MLSIDSPGVHFIGCLNPLPAQRGSVACGKANEKNLKTQLMLAEECEDCLKSVGRYAYARTWPPIRFYSFHHQYGRMLQAFFTLFIQHPIQVLHHFLCIGTRRFLHERKIRKTHHP